MGHQTHLTVTEPISSTPYGISIISDPARVDRAVPLPADVWISINGPVAVSLRMRPADAQALAEQLAMAAAVAAAPEAEIIPFSLEEAA